MPDVHIPTHDTATEELDDPDTLAPIAPGAGKPFVNFMLPFVNVMLELSLYVFCATSEHKACVRIKLSDMMIMCPQLESITVPSWS